MSLRASHLAVKLLDIKKELTDNKNICTGIKLKWLLSCNDTSKYLTVIVLLECSLSF